MKNVWSDPDKRRRIVIAATIVLVLLAGLGIFLAVLHLSPAVAWIGLTAIVLGVLQHLVRGTPAESGLRRAGGAVVGVVLGAGLGVVLLVLVLISWDRVYLNLIPIGSVIGGMTGGVFPRAVFRVANVVMSFAPLDW